jgi:tight adherence protein B
LLGRRRRQQLAGDPRLFLSAASFPTSSSGSRRRSAFASFEDQLPDLLITMAASLKAGHSFKQGIQSVVDEGQEPAAKELRRVITDTQLGRPMEERSRDGRPHRLEELSFVITA